MPSRTRSICVPEIGVADRSVGSVGASPSGRGDRGGVARIRGVRNRIDRTDHVVVGGRGSGGGVRIGRDVADGVDQGAVAVDPVPGDRDVVAGAGPGQVDTMRADDGSPEDGGRRGALGVIESARGGGIGEPGAVRHGVQGLDLIAVGRRWLEVEVGIRRDVADGRDQGVPTVDLVVRDPGVVGRGRPGQIDAGGAGGRRGEIGRVGRWVAVGRGDRGGVAGSEAFGTASIARTT